MDVQVSRGVAPFDFASAVDSGMIRHLIDEKVEAYVADCVVRRGGVTSYEPSEAQGPGTEEVILDFPNFELLRERGRTLQFGEVDPSIRREDFTTDLEYAEAQMRATADRWFTEDENALRGDCESESDFEQVQEFRDLYDALWGSWVDELQEIDSSGEVNERRGDFRDCVVEGGMQPSPELNEVVYWAIVDAEFLSLPTDDQQRLHVEQRGRLFAECAEEIYEVKEHLRREAHDRFVEVNADDLARLSEYLYGGGS